MGIANKDKCLCMYCVYMHYIATLAQVQSPFYNLPVVRGCNPLLGCFAQGLAAHRGKPV